MNPEWAAEAPGADLHFRGYGDQRTCRFLLDLEPLYIVGDLNIVVQICLIF